MRYLVLLFIALLTFTGCVSASQTVDESVASEIPEGANVINLYSDMEPAKYYDTIYSQLAREGYEIAASDDERLTLSTGPRDVGQETTLALRLFVEEAAASEARSRAMLRGRWGVSGTFAAGMSAGFGAGIDQNVGEPAEWKQSNRAGVAFGAMAQFVSELPHQSVEYVTE